MKTIKVLEYTGGFGYNQSILLLKTEDGYLCIDFFGLDYKQDRYKIGELIDPSEEIESYEIEEKTIFVEDIPLYETFLGKKFLLDYIKHQTVISIAL